MSEIVWGDLIKVDERPSWIGEDQEFIPSNSEGDWSKPYIMSDIVIGWGDRGVSHIRLPATHPFYTATSKGFKYWPGGDRAPDDWDGGDVLLQSGRICNSQFITDWSNDGVSNDIIGYKPKSIYSGGVVTPEDVRAKITKPKFIAPKRCAGVTYDEYMVQLATAFQNWVNGDIVEEEPTDHLLEIAQNIAADICDSEGCYSDYVKFMREGAYNETHREIKIALAALKRGMEMR